MLSKILTVAESISRLLDDRGGGYEESLSDAREHFDRLLTPGWLLAGQLERRLVEFRGLELRLTRLFGSPPAKDLAKLERYRAASADIWAQEAACECGECPFPVGYLDQLQQDGDLRLREFAQELRRN